MTSPGETLVSSVANSEIAAQEAAQSQNYLQQAIQRVGRFASRTVLSLSLAVSGGVAVGTAAEVLDTRPKAAYGLDVNGYPDDDATDCSASFGVYSWCKDENGNGRFDAGEQNSSRGYDYNNCTDFAAWVVNKETGLDISGMSHATLWDNRAASKGLIVRPVAEGPQIGDIAHWEGNDENPVQGYGHVGIVVSTDPLRIAEYNGGGDGNYRIRPNNDGIDHFIAVPGLSGGSGGQGNGQEVTDGNGVYTTVGGSYWYIKPRSQWTAGDSTYWGGGELAQVTTGQIHEREAGYTSSGRVVGAHPPADGTVLYVAGGNGQQYYFTQGKAYQITVGELDDLNARNRATPIPATGDRLSDFTGRPLDLENGTLYRFAGNPNVRQFIIEAGGRKAYMVGNYAIAECLRLTQGKVPVILPNAAGAYMNTHDTLLPAGCSFPSGWIIQGPSRVEQWRIEGNNSSIPYTRRYFPDDLTAYLHTSGNPEFRYFSSATALNSIELGPNMTLPNGAFFVNDGNGDQFKIENGVFRKIPWPDMNACLGNTNPIHVPGDKVGAIPQGPMMGCQYDNKILVRPDGRAYWVEGGRKHSIGNAAVRDCISALRGTGNWISESHGTIDSYTDSSEGYCEFERDYGLKFVQEEGDHAVYFVEPNGTLRHAGSLCVGDPYTTQWKQFRVWKMRPGLIARPQSMFGPDWWADGAKCDALPKVWMG